MAKKNDKQQEFIRITTKVEGFRRAGMEHYGTAEYPVSRFSKEQIAALKTELLLTVSFFKVAAPEPNKTPEEEPEKEEEESAPPAEPVGETADAENPAP